MACWDIRALSVAALVVAACSTGELDGGLPPNGYATAPDDGSGESSGRTVIRQCPFPGDTIRPPAVGCAVTPTLKSVRTAEM